MRRARMLGMAAAIAAAIPMSAAAGARAHGEEAIALAAGAQPGRLQAALEDPPAIRDLELRLLQGPIPALFVRNGTGEPLEVLDARGAVTLRIGPHGVQRRLATSRGGGRWQTLSPQPAWAWVEPRAGVAVHHGGATPHTVRRWTIPLRLGGRTLPLRGRVDWVPAPGNTGVAGAGWLLSGRPAAVLLSRLAA